MLEPLFSHQDSNMDIKAHVEMIGMQALKASRELLSLSSRRKNTILNGMADGLESRKKEVLAANAKDIQEAENNGLPPSIIDRLTITEARFSGMVKGLRAVAGLKDPIGARISRWIRPNGLEIIKQRVPIGVIAIIFESRPNVTSDSAALCFKTSNAVILRGGKESVHSNAAIADAITDGGREKGLPENAIQLLRIPDHEAVNEMVRLTKCIDLIIPRGGEKLIRAVTENALVPVIKHYKGVCHIYVDESANQEMALRIIENAKCQRPGVCNAMEALVVHKNIAAEFLPKVAELLGAKDVELRGDATARSIVSSMTPASEENWSEEYLALILNVRVVDSCDAAIDHINNYGSRHSDAIVTENEEAASSFLRNVDSSSVYVNASTRFTDGSEFGMGAEIGISTDKLHCRGPMGLEELTTYKFLIKGNGQVRE